MLAETGIPVLGPLYVCSGLQRVQNLKIKCSTIKQYFSTLQKNLKTNWHKMLKNKIVTKNRKIRLAQKEQKQNWHKK